MNFNQIKLSPQSMKVLNALRDIGLTRGFELRRKAELPGSQDLVTAIEPLVRANLVAASGTLDAYSIDSAQFAPLSQAFKSGSLIVEA